MEYYIFCAILLMMFLYRIRIEKADGSQVEMLERFNYLRGAFQLFIVIGHCSMRFEKEILPLLVIHKFNMVGVCFFFFISGWGLTYAYLEKEKRTDGFVRRKIVSLLAMSLVSTLLFYILNEIILCEKSNLSFMSIWCFALDKTNWYIWEICFFYILFYLCIRFKWQKYIVSIFLAAAFLICVTAWILHWERAYYISAFSFPFGIILNRYWNKINSSFRKYKGLPIAIFMIGILSACSVMLPQDTFFGGIARNFFGIMAMSILWIILSYVKMENRFLYFLRGISLEMYLYQFPVMAAFRSVFKKYGRDVDLYYVISVLITLTVVSVVISGLRFALKKKFGGTV